MLEAKDHPHLKKALGRIPSGLFVLTARHEGSVHVILASWVQQASFEPPAISVAVARDRQIAEAIRASKQFALSIIWDKSKSLMKHFATPAAAGTDPFKGVRVMNTPNGLPVMIDSLGWLDCQVISTCDFSGDHELFIGQITAAASLHDGKPILHLRENGLKY